MSTQPTREPIEPCCPWHNENCHDLEEVCCWRCPLHVKNHSETHTACDARLEAEGGKTRCCYCVPHDGCDLSQPDVHERKPGRPTLSESADNEPHPADPKPSESTGELDEILSMAFVGLYTRTSDNSFAPVDDKYHVLYDNLKTELEALISEQTTKARVEEVEHLMQWNGSFIHDCGRRIDGILHRSVLEERLAELNSGDTPDVVA